MDSDATLEDYENGEAFAFHEFQFHADYSVGTLEDGRVIVMSHPEIRAGIAMTPSDAVTLGEALVALGAQRGGVSREAN